MKKMISRMLVTVPGLLLVMAALAQKSSIVKTDKLLFLNISNKEGKILAFADDRVQFGLTRERRNYEFPKNRNEKEEFATGKTDAFIRPEALISNPIKAPAKTGYYCSPGMPGFVHEAREKIYGRTKSSIRSERYVYQKTACCLLLRTPL